MPHRPTVLPALIFATITVSGPRVLEAAQPPAAPAAGARAPVKHPAPPRLDEAWAAGLPRGSNPEILTWDWAYHLALARSRSARPGSGGGFAERLDPVALDEQSRKLGLTDLARFRKDFLGEQEGGGRAAGTFRDPSQAMFDVLRRRQAVDAARADVIHYEQLLRTMTELIQGESSGLSQVEVDQCDAALQQARRRMVEELTGYRDRLDELKVELGLSPHAPLVPDRRSIDVFLETFESVEGWHRDPARKLEDLPRFALQLPELDDVVLEFVAGRPVLDVLHREPDLLESTLTAVEEASVRNREPGDSEVSLRLSVRRRVRSLMDTTIAYELERKRFVLAVRLKDQAFVRLFEPAPEDESPPATAMKDLTRCDTQVTESENRLVALWTSFLSGRLALYREIGTFPYSDWTSFYAQFQARRGEGGPGARQVQAVPEADVIPAAPALPAPPPAPAPPAPAAPRPKR